MSVPHKCPVCNGRGKVPADFYNKWIDGSAHAGEETCRTCQGTGLVWGEAPINMHPTIQDVYGRLTRHHIKPNKALLSDFPLKRYTFTNPL